LQLFIFESDVFYVGSQAPKKKVHNSSTKWGCQEAKGCCSTTWQKSEEITTCCITCLLLVIAQGQHVIAKINLVLLVLTCAHWHTLVLPNKHLKALKNTDAENPLPILARNSKYLQACSRTVDRIFS
jgi:hypothetical protein